MEWFSVWLPLVSQLIVPLSLLAWLAFARHAMKARAIAITALVATYILAIGVAGLWLVLPGGSPSSTARWSCGPSHVTFVAVITSRKGLEAHRGSW